MDEAIDWQAIAEQLQHENELLKIEKLHFHMYNTTTFLEMLFSVWSWIRSNIRYISIAFDCILIVMSLIWLKRVWSF